MKNVLLILATFFVLTPTAFASKFVYLGTTAAANCATYFLTFSGGASCTGNNLQLAVSVGQSGGNTANPDPNFTWSNGVQYFFVVSSTGTTGDWLIRITDAVANNNNSGTTPANSTNAQLTITPTMTGTQTILQPMGNTPSVSTTDALITYLCASTVSYADCTPASPVVSISRLNFWSYFW